MDDKKERKIVILGEEIDKKFMPKMCGWGRTHPDTLERNIRGMMKKQCYTNPGSAMAILESDLATDRDYGYDSKDLELIEEDKMEIAKADAEMDAELKRVGVLVKEEPESKLN